MERYRTVKTRFREHAEELFPIDHSLAHRTVSLPPRPAALFPEEVLERDHGQSWRHKVERRAPPAISPFDHRMTDVEVIADGCRVKPFDEWRKIPDRTADVPCVVVISEPHPV